MGMFLKLASKSLIKVNESKIQDTSYVEGSNY